MSSIPCRVWILLSVLFVVGLLFVTNVVLAVIYVALLW